MNSHIRKTNQIIWKPGSHLAADEVMVPFDGRTKEKTFIPTKPNSTGLKVWAVAQGSFRITWNFHTPGEGKGPVDTQVPIELGGGTGKGNKTQAVVVKMMDQLPQPPLDHPPLYHLFLDNLFTSTRFLVYMRDTRRIGLQERPDLTLA